MSDAQAPLTYKRIQQNTSVSNNAVPASMSRSAYRLNYRSDVEGLRAVAILLVVAVHAGIPWVEGGFIGVDVFFVLSGFLITGLLVREINGTGGVNFSEFYLRRLRRLLPALLFMLGSVCLLAFILLPPSEQINQATAAGTASIWASNIHFALEQIDYFEPDASTNLFLHTWSLGVEEQFYLVWPMLLLWLTKPGSKQGATRIRGGLVALIIVTLVASVTLSYTNSEIAFYMMPTRAWQFATGGLVFISFGASTQQHRQRALAAAPATGWLGLIVLLATATIIDASTAYPGFAAIAPTAGTALILYAGSVSAHRGVARFLSWKPLQSLGRISYSWYLWHWPVLLLMKEFTDYNRIVYRLIAVSASLLIAILSYRFIEKPVRHAAVLLAHRKRSISGAICLMLAFCLAAGWWYIQAGHSPYTPKLQVYRQARSEAPRIYAMGCNARILSADVHICRFGASDAKHTAILIGDSTAAHWSPAAIKAFDEPGWRLLVMTKSGCPMVDGPFVYRSLKREFTECAHWRMTALKKVVAMRPDIIIMSSYWLNGVRSRDWWVAGTAHVLSLLSPAAGHIFVLQSTPHLPFRAPKCLEEQEVFSKVPILQDKFRCETSYSGTVSAQIASWIDAATGQFSNASSIDMNDLVCPDGQCDAEYKGIVTFRDDHHLTPRFAKTLSSDLSLRMDADLDQSHKFPITQNGAAYH